MRFTLLSTIFSYILGNYFTDFLFENFAMNSLEIYKFIAHILGAGVMQFILNVGYLKYRDRKSHEIYYTQQTLQQAKIEETKTATHSLENRVSRLEGIADIFMRFYRTKNKALFSK